MKKGYLYLSIFIIVLAIYSSLVTILYNKAYEKNNNENYISRIYELDSINNVLNTKVDSLINNIKIDSVETIKIKIKYENEIKAINDSSITYNMILFSNYISKTNSIK